MADLCQAQFEQLGDVTVVRLSGEIDIANAPEVRSRITEQHVGGMLVLDLDGMVYFDSSGLAMLEDLNASGKLRLALGPSSPVRRTLAITGLDQVLPLFATLEEALRSP